jgi:p-cumate 2,3-dioxygenase beta subunit
MTELRAEIEDLFFREAELLDQWRLEEWLTLLTDDASYYVPSNDRPDASHRDTLFTIADNNARLKERVRRILDPGCHAEHPHSRTRRLIGNVRIAAETGDVIEATANFIIHRFRRGDDTRIFVGQYRYKLRRVAGALKISERRVILDAEELGMLGAVSFIL